MNTNRYFSVRTALCAALLPLLTACGGGGGTTSPTAPPPVSNTPAPTPTPPAPTTPPPFSGTIFLDPDIITASDPTTFQGLTDKGQGTRSMFDRRVNAFVTVNAYVFGATFSDGLTAEVQVNPEFGGTDAARAVAEQYTAAIGRIPRPLRVSMATVWIHQGVQAFGGGNNNLLIHTGQGDEYIANGILEETFVHEASHTSLDALHAASAGWLAAQTADGTYISTYAQENPQREDVAESFLPYLAVKYRADRVSADLANTIRTTIPNRIAYFDSALGTIIMPE